MRLSAKRKGMTLVELVVVTALLTVVIAAAASFYYFGSKTFSEGEGQAVVQRNLRAVQECILNELRNSTEVGVYDQTTQLEAGKRGITLSAADSEFKCIYLNASGEVESAPSISPVSEAVLTFRNGSGKVLLSYGITANLKNGNFELSGEVLLNNVQAAGLKNIAFDTEYKLSEVSLYYIKPQ